MIYLDAMKRMVERFKLGLILPLFPHLKRLASSVSSALQLHLPKSIIIREAAHYNVISRSYPRYNNQRRLKRTTSTRFECHPSNTPRNSINSLQSLRSSENQYIRRCSHSIRFWRPISQEEEKSSDLCAMQAKIRRC